MVSTENITEYVKLGTKYYNMFIQLNVTTTTTTIDTTFKS